MRIQIEKYNPEWSTKFDNESALLNVTLKGFFPTIEHIGSTSIKNLGAKPIIDIMIGFPNFENIGSAINKIQEIGYQYVQEFEKDMPDRRFFFKVNKGKKTHHIHLVEIHSNFWKRHLAFRDHLRINKLDLEAYFQLKSELSKKDWKDVNEYAAAKNEFIRSIEKKLHV